MPALLDTRMERLAHLLAAGMSRAQACRLSGYSATTAAVKSHKIAARPDVTARVLELTGGVAPAALTGSRAPAHESQLAMGSWAAPGGLPAPRAVVVAQPPFLPAIEPVEAPRPLPRIDLANASPEQARRWSLSVLSEVIHEAHFARDRRIVVNAMTEANRLNGLHIQKIEHLQASVLDGLTRAELLTLAEALRNSRVEDGMFVIDGDAVDHNDDEAEQNAELLDDPLA